MVTNKMVDWKNIKFNRIISSVKQQYIEDIGSEIENELNNIELNKRLSPQMTVGVTVGSRGISNIVEITKFVVDYIKSCGAIPYIIPSMGSHGGATTEGQVHMLNNLGINQESIGCEILASMEVEEIGITESGYTVHVDKFAKNLDGIFVINRVKPHTDFESDIESGLVKMVGVGLGNQVGCNHIHSLGLAKGVYEVGKYKLEKLNIIGGLGIVENSHDETYLLKAIKKEDFIEEDKKMLELSKSLVPRLPIDDIDVLIVREIGKTYSGTGMDTKVIGRIRIDGTEEPKTPNVKMIVALNLSDLSDGNALGVGLADIITKEFKDKIDLNKTYTNVISTTYLERGKVPITLENDKVSIDTAMSCIGDKTDLDKSIVIIDNTLHLNTMLISENVNTSLYGDRFEIVESGIVLKYDNDGKLLTD